MALPAWPGNPTPTPTPRPVSEGFVSAGDYLTMEIGRLAEMNQNQTSTLGAIKTYVEMLRDTVVAAET